MKWVVILNSVTEVRVFGPFDSIVAASSWNAMRADGQGKVQRLRPGRSNGS